MNQNGWTFALAMFKNDGTSLGQAAVNVDFEPARQWARHVALCEGRALAGPDGASVQPIWHSRGEPFLRGFRVVLHPASAEHETGCVFPTTYFKSYAGAFSPSFIEAGALNAGDTFRYLPMAIRREHAAPGTSRLSLVVEDVSPVPGTTDTPLDAMCNRVSTIGCPLEGEIPAFVSKDVVCDVMALARAGTPMETGGALVGRLHRDAARCRVFVEITGQIPAQHTEASSARLLFTAETWHDLMAAIERRGQGEVMVGWWHSHPVREWCRSTAAKDGTSHATALEDCFSEHDGAVHRTVFPAAHCLALVASDLSDTDLRLSVYGWHLGMLHRRGLHILGTCR